MCERERERERERGVCVDVVNERVKWPSLSLSFLASVCVCALQISHAEPEEVWISLPPSLAQTDAFFTAIVARLIYYCPAFGLPAIAETEVRLY